MKQSFGFLLREETGGLVLVGAGLRGTVSTSCSWPCSLLRSLLWEFLLCLLDLAFGAKAKLPSSSERCWTSGNIELFFESTPKASDLCFPYSFQVPPWPALCYIFAAKFKNLKGFRCGRGLCWVSVSPEHQGMDSPCTLPCVVRGQGFHCPSCVHPARF